LSFDFKAQGFDPLMVQSTGLDLSKKIFCLLIWCKLNIFLGVVFAMFGFTDHQKGG